MTVLLVAAYANPKRGENIFCAWKNPRGAPAGIELKRAVVEPGTRPTSSEGIPSPARIKPLYRLPEPGTIVPLLFTFTAFEGSYRAGTKLAMLLACVYHGCSHSQRTPKSRLSLRFT